MKKLFLVLMCACLLCGCSAKEKELPTLTEETVEDLDIATYKKNWNGEENESITVLNDSVERYEPSDALSGEEFVFSLTGDLPEEVSVTEYLVRDREIVLNSDLILESREIESNFDGSKLSFKIGEDNISENRLEDRLVCMDFKWLKGENVTDEVEYAFLLQVVDEKINTRPLYKAEELNTYNGVEMYVESTENVTPTTMIAKIKNESGSEIVVASRYRIDRNDDYGWVKLNYMPTVGNVEWSSAKVNLIDGVEVNLPVDWSELFGELENGHYRLVKTFRLMDDSEEYEMAAEFVIE